MGQLQPELLDKSSCGGTSRLGTEDVRGGLLLTPVAGGHHCPFPGCGGELHHPSSPHEVIQVPYLALTLPKGCIYFLCVFTSLNHFLKV